jgi:diguanylate cyclase (GGDEF)-like protein
MTAASSRRLVARELAPFALAALLAFVLLPIGSPMDWGEYALALGLTVGVMAGIVLGPWSAFPIILRLLLPAAFLLAVALLRDAGGGSNSGVSILVLLPVFWVALYGTRRVLGAMVLGIGAFYTVPILLVGGEAYPATGLRTAVLFMLVAGLVGSTVQGLVGQVRAQFAERELLLARLERQALTDPLTSAGNRRAWDRWLALATATRSARPFAIGVLDLDHFKAYNDEHGHGAGDALLAAAAEAWRGELRPGDQLARIGGEEFAVLLPATDLAGATAVLQRLTAATPGGPTCSGGVAEWIGSESPESLVRRADNALYAAKRGGRDRVEQAGTGRFGARSLVS